MNKMDASRTKRFKVAAIVAVCAAMLTGTAVARSRFAVHYAPQPTWVEQYEVLSSVPPVDGPPEQQPGSCTPGDWSHCYSLCQAEKVRPGVELTEVTCAYNGQGSVNCGCWTRRCRSIQA